LTQYAHEERARANAQVAKTDKTGSFKRTGWLDYFANRNLIHPAHQTRLPDRGEVKLRWAAKLTELLVEEPVNPSDRRYLVTLCSLFFQRLFVRRNFYVLSYGVQPCAHPSRWQPSDPARLASGEPYASNPELALAAVPR
jgi:hypothetical protein